MTQMCYTQNTDYVPSHSSFEEIRKYRAIFSWHINTRPDGSFFANNIDQATNLTHRLTKAKNLIDWIRKTKIFMAPRPKLKHIDNKKLNLQRHFNAFFVSYDALIFRIVCLVLYATKFTVSIILIIKKNQSILKLWHGCSGAHFQRG